MTATIQQLRALVRLADNLREAQKAYMTDRGNEVLGRRVGQAAQSYDNRRAQVKRLA